MNDPDVELRALLLFEQLFEEPAARERLLGAELPAVRDAVLTLEAASSRSRASFPTVDGEQPARALMAIPRQVGVYRLGALIGEGGMAMVFAADRDDGLFEHHVAVKLIHPDCFSPSALARFADERRILARIEHPAVARLIDGGIADGWPYILMERIDGVPITRFVEQHELEQTDRVQMIVDVCAAVSAAHGALIAHGDIKPDNVLVEQGGRVRLLDFGVARLIEGDGAGQTAPLTPDFASPERRAGGLPSVSDDIYALGLLMAATLRSEAVSADLDAILSCATAPDVGARYGSVDALCTDLRRWQQQRPVAARQPTAAYRAQLYIARNWRILAAVALALIALGAVGTMAYRGWHQAQVRSAQADANATGLRRLSGYLLGELYDRLAAQPGTAQRRAEIATQAAAYLANLQVSQAAAPDLRLETARAYRRLAAVQGLPSVTNLGQPDAARVSLAKAEHLLGAPDDPGRADLFAERGWLAIDRWSLGGEGQDSIALTRDAKRDFATAQAIDPQNMSSRLGLIAASGNEAYDQLWTLDRPGDARDTLAHALAALRAQLWPPALRRYAIILEMRLLARLGDALYQADRPTDALKAYVAADRRLDAAMARYGTTPQFVILKGEYAFNIAGTLEDQPARLGEAINVADRGIALLNTLLAQGTDAAAEKKLLVLLAEKAVLLRAQGKIEAALAPSAESVALREKRLAGTPADPQRMRDLAIGLAPHAELLAQAHHPVEACATATRAVDTWRAIAAAGHLGALDKRKNQPNATALRERFCPATPSA